MEIEYIKVNDVVYNIHDPNGGGSSDELWKPTVDSSGNISWQKSTSPALPTPQNIKGQPGVKGSDGVSPGVTVTTITGGHRVTITDAAHPSGQSFDVMDGQGGSGGDGGVYSFTVTKDASDNVYLSNGVTMQDIYTAVTENKMLLCHAGDAVFIATGIYLTSGGTINATLERRTISSKTNQPIVESITLSSTATTGNGFYTYRYGVDSRNYSPVTKTADMDVDVGLDTSTGRLYTTGGGSYVLMATVDGSQNLFLPNGVTVQDVYDAFTAGKQVICMTQDGIHTLTGGFMLSNGVINMTFECRTLTGKTNAHLVGTAVLASDATTGNGFYTFRYGVDSRNYSPTSKTSAMTKQVGADSSGQLWTTP